MKRLLAASLLLVAILLITGCQTGHVELTNPTADGNPANPAYWYAQPAPSSASANDFDQLWKTSEEVLRSYLFEIDRREPRSGVMTTQPMVSAQWFEPWRRELTNADDTLTSSVQTVRRTVQLQFTKTDAGYTVTPRVVVEQQSIQPKRVSGLLSRTYFRRVRGDDTYGDRATDAGQLNPTNYWYATGRDQALEEVLARKIRDGLQ